MYFKRRQKTHLCAWVFGLKFSSQLKAACKGTVELLDLLVKIKAVQGVNRIVCSEEVYLLPRLRKAVVIPFESKKP
jgi:hypothetical protein